MKKTLIGLATPEQIEAWKKSYKAVYVIYANLQDRN